MQGYSDLDKLKRLIGEAMGNEELAKMIEDDSDLINDIGLDSLSIINLMLQVEDEFAVEIDFDNFDEKNLYSAETFLAYIDSLRG